jgi:hypothetical protein
LWKPPTIERLKIDQNPSIVLVWTDHTDNVLTGSVPNLLMRIIVQTDVHAAFAGREQDELVRHDLTHEAFRVYLGDPGQEARNYVALALDGSNDRRLANSAAALSATPISRLAYPPPPV